MTDFCHSTQLSSWLYTPELLAKCRARANREARKALMEAAAAAEAAKAKAAATTTTTTTAETTEIDSTMVDTATNTAAPAPAPAPALAPSKKQQQQQQQHPVQWFACGYRKRHNQEEEGEEEEEDNNVIANNDDNNNNSSSSLPFLTPHEEGMLISFYSSKIPSLIGPQASMGRLRRDVKVVATASLLFRRFFLSNSVMMHDPKAYMVAAAFLASKIEDAMADIRLLEEATQLLNAPVDRQDILPAELRLLTGVHFDLLCFHPYKAVLAYTEDLRTFLKTEKGRSLVGISAAANENNNGSNNKPQVTVVVSGEDLRPMHDRARQLVDLACLSDIPLLYSPGQVGLAALMVANEEVSVVKIDMLQYVQRRFAEHAKAAAAATTTTNISTNMNQLVMELTKLQGMLKGLSKGEYGCGVFIEENVDLAALKAINKKLKKCRRAAWGGGEASSSTTTKKKKKKRKANEINDN